jgi:hypothetical protein
MNNCRNRNTKLATTNQVATFNGFLLKKMEVYRIHTNRLSKGEMNQPRVITIPLISFCPIKSCVRCTNRQTTKNILQMNANLEKKETALISVKVTVISTNAPIAFFNSRQEV